MKNLFWLFLLSTLFFNTVRAQSGGSTQPGNATLLSGTVIDSTARKPVSFATVALLKSTTITTGTTTDEQGRFSFTDVTPGSYTLTVSFVGYRTTTRPGVTITAGQPTDLGTVSLRADTRTLGEVNVVAQKPLIEDKGDRLVYNAENDLANAGGTAVDVMRKVPMLSVDLDGTLKMRGSSNIKVLVNGKPSAIMARNLADALKQMPANSIKSIEVITSPGAKYDAEGSAGVINIITKKAITGTNGSVNATGGNLNRGLGLNLTVKGKKLGFATQLNSDQYRNISSSSGNRTTLVDGQPAGDLYQRSDRDNISLSGNGTMSIDYDPDSLNRISLSATAWGGNFPNNVNLYTRQTDAQGAVVQEYDRAIRHRNPFGNTEFNLGWTRTFKQPGREFSVLSQYSRTPDNYFYDLSQTTPGSDATTYLERATNYSRNKEYTLQTDYAHPFKLNWHDTTTAKLEVGAKTIRRDIGSDYLIESSLTGREADYAIDPARSNQFTYSQQVTAGYASLKLDTKSKWSLTSGLRLEHTRIMGDFPTTNTSFSNGYTNLIPSVTLAKTMREKHTVKASYTQRISRPLIWYLNPYRDYTDAKNVRTGNPYLSPELTHATELSYSTFNKEGSSFNAALYWRQTNNSIEFLTTVDAQGVGLSGPQNIGRNASYGLNINGVWQASKALSVTVGTDIVYVDLISRALSLRNRGWIGNFNATVSYKLPHDLTLEANGYANTGGVALQSDYSGVFFYGLSAKKEFMTKKASLTLNINNPFTPANILSVNQFSTTFVAQQRLAFVNQSVRLTFSYKFGSTSSGSGKTSRKIANDDSKR
ncbi:TonB-dependent receptor domain-containing protein [Spirosoma rhododendri]|uniref:TonB-dependent receptor n=1 Tax=Spirosoma rhododendri TaxID=2728024 RepID=A0A7L5DNT8_9BACT|nr:TonB-dependent receptor [Spirosoma rhododendri]QJD77420.1 TonB-dependent receptor [Spirosoma rhododendri]